MGREIKRVPIGFSIPLEKTWWGYLLPPIWCQACDGKGTSPKIICGFKQHDDTWHTFESYDCPVCGGDGKVCPRVEVPEGPGYQLWETVSEGSPLSPSFETPEELARWLADNNASSGGRTTETYEVWLAWIKGPAWSPSFVVGPGGIQSGVQAMLHDEERG